MVAEDWACALRAGVGRVGSWESFTQSCEGFSLRAVNTVRLLLPRLLCRAELRTDSPNMPLNSILDSAITRRLARYLEMSDASSGFSDVVVKDGHITVHHAFAKLEPANELLAEKGVPAVVRLCYLKKLDVQIPWGHLSSGEVSIEAEELYVLLRLPDHERSPERVRRAREALIVQQMEELLSARRLASARRRRSSTASSASCSPTSAR